MRNRNEIAVQSRTGETMRALYEVEADGSLSIKTEDKHGYASAHLGAARKALGGKIRKVVDHSWMDNRGVKSRLTVWRLAA